MRALVARHGAGEVWRKGLEALGFPPTWTTNGRELVAVRKALEVRDGD